MIKLKDKVKRPKTNLNILNNNIDYNQYKPIFSFEFLQDGFNFKNREQLQNKHFKTFLYKIETLSNLTWFDIIKLPRQDGMENIEIKQNPKYVTDDVQLKSIRFGEIERIIGYRRNNIFYILYIDVDGSCYKH